MTLSIMRQFTSVWLVTDAWNSKGRHSFWNCMIALWLNGLTISVTLLCACHSLSISPVCFSLKCEKGPLCVDGCHCCISWGLQFLLPYISQTVVCLLSQVSSSSSCLLLLQTNNAREAFKYFCPVMCCVDVLPFALLSSCVLEISIFLCCEGSENQIPFAPDHIFGHSKLSYVFQYPTFWKQIISMHDLIYTVHIIQ